MGLDDEIRELKERLGDESDRIAEKVATMAGQVSETFPSGLSVRFADD